MCAQDVVIVGGGLLGLSTALSVKEKMPRARICVLERGIFPSGASTRNAGFACFAKACEMLSDIEKQGEKKAAKLAHDRFMGLQKLRSRISDSAMEYDQLGGHELILNNEDPVSQSDLDRLNNLLEPYFPDPVFSIQNDKIRSFGLSGVQQLIYNPLEGQIHSGKLISALWRLINALGIRVITGAEVKHIEEGLHQVEVFVSHSYLGEDVRFTASQVAICTNALAGQLVENNLNIQPGRGQVLVTEPIPGLELQGTFHFDEGYYYFRNHENRIILGGGRNIDFEGENTAEFGFNKKIQDELDHVLKTIVMPEKTVKVAHRWSGIMGFNDTKTPVVKKVGQRRFIGFTCNGMGIALSSLTGELLADEIVKR